MNVLEFLKTKVMKALGMARLPSDPNDGRMTYINDDEAIRISNVKANGYWYLGDGDELLNWYTNQQTYGWAENPIYNRNRRQYFWGLSIDEAVKRVHSGVPRAIVDTISNIVGKPTITGDPRLDAIFDANDFWFLLTQRARPMALVKGDGCWKVNAAPSMSAAPIIEWYDAEDWTPIVKAGQFLGAVFKSYYKGKDGKDYVLFETRTRRKDGVAIEYDLYRLLKDNALERCGVDALPETQGLRPWLISGGKDPMCVPMKYYFDPLRPNRGKSVYDGKLDLFDTMDEILTQAGQTNRVSTPVEYYPVDLLQRTDRGVPILPKVYNRQYVKLETAPDGDGNLANQIQTTQPQLDFDKYGRLFQDVLGTALVGVLSPSTLGIGIARDDNAEAQREKEKQSIFTRNTIISNETRALKALCSCLLSCQDYLESGVFADGPAEVSIKYDEFANPSFESELQTLGPAWSNGQISTERFVQLLWAGKLSDEEMAKEATWLDENREKDSFDLGALQEGGHEEGIGADIPGEGREEAETPVAEE